MNYHLSCRRNLSLLPHFNKNPPTKTDYKTKPSTDTHLLRRGIVRICLRILLLFYILYFFHFNIFCQQQIVGGSLLFQKFS